MPLPEGAEYRMSARSEAASRAPAQHGRFLWTRRHIVALLILCLAQLIELIDITIVNVALPTMGRALGFSQSNLPWIVNSYIVLFGGALLLGGRSGDLLGQRRVFLSGILAFTVASLASGLAQSASMLIVTRAAQGLAAAFVSPMTLAMIASGFPEGAPRNRALAAWGAVGGISGSLGVTLGGMLASGPGWRWIFLVNIPAGLLILALAPKYLNADRPARTHRTFDLAGAVTATAGVTLLAYAVSQTSSHPWGSARTIALLATAGATIAVFALHEIRFAKEPLIPFSIFSNRSVRGANVVGALVGGSMFATFYFFSLYQQQVLHYSALKTGMAYLPLTGTLMVFAAITPVLVPRLGIRWLLVLGGVIGAAGTFMFAHDSPAGGLWGDVIIPSLVVAPGLALTFVPMTLAAVAGVPLADTGIASGLANVSRTVGGALGLSIITAIATERATSLLRGGDAVPAGLSDGFRLGFTISACVLAASALAAALLFRDEGRGKKVGIAEMVSGG
jgi:EmrB/QacA subfamily drug resistance transporter